MVCTVCIYFNNLLNSLFFSVELIVKVLVSIAIFTVLLVLLSQKERAKSALTIVLLVCVVTETLIFNFNNLNTFNSIENLEEKQVVDELTKNISESDRIHFASQKQEYKDLVQYDLNFGFNGWENYSSLANGDFSLAMEYLGTYGNSLNMQNGAYEQTPIFNMLYPTKYYIDGTGHLEESSFRTKIAEKEGYILYENNYTMPFMYTISDTIDKWDPFSYIVVSDNQNAIAKYVTNFEENIVAYNNPTNFKFENCTHISAVERAEANGVDMPDEYFEFLEKRMAGYSYKIDDMTKPAYITFDSVAEAVF